MPTYFTALALLHSGSASPPGDIAAAGESLAHDREVRPFTPDPVGLDLLVRLVGLPVDRVPAYVELEFTGVVGVGEALRASGYLGDTVWTITLDDGTTTTVANTEPIIDVRSLQVVSGSPVWTPVPALRFSGAALALIGSGTTGVSVRVTTQSRFDGGWSTVAIAAFAAGSTNADRRAVATQAYNAVVYRSGGAQAVQGNAGTPGGPAYPPTTLQQDAALVDCVWSGPAPWGAVYVDTSDVGVSSTERTRIPADVASNSLAAYQRYPAAFLRRPTFGRGVELLDQWPDAITTGDGALTIYATSQDLAWSQWRFQVDGASFVVLLNHNGVAGLRRPADVWNQVIVPAMSSGAPLEVWDLCCNDPVPKFGGLLSRLEFLEYAVFMLGLVDGEEGVENAYTVVAQTGGVTPPEPPGG